MGDGYCRPRFARPRQAQLDRELLSRAAIGRHVAASSRTAVERTVPHIGTARGWLLARRFSRGRTWLRLVARAALFIPLTSTSALPQSPAVAEAKDPEPIALLGVPGNRVVQWPSVAARSDTIFVVGNVFQSDSLGARPAYLGRLYQSAAGSLKALSPVELPPGDFLFAYPRIVVAGSKLHLIWAEFATRPHTAFAWQRATYLAKSLWHAVLDDGAWSSPQRIASGDALGWSDEVGGVAVGADGIVHVAAWKGDNGGVPHVNDFRFVAGRWENTILPFTGLNPSTAISTRSDTLAISLVDERLDTARVIVLESIDQGKHWGNPFVVAQRSRRQATVTHLSFVTADRTLILTIGEKPPNSAQLDTIRMVRLNGSRAFSAPLLIPPPPAADQFVATGTSCGSALMLTRSLSARPQIVQTTISLDSSRSVSRRLLSNSGFSAFPGIIATQRSVIAVFAYNRAIGAPTWTAAMTVSVCPPFPR